MLFSVDDSVLLGYDAASLCNQTLTSRGDVAFYLQRSRNFQDRALRTWARILFVARMCMSIFVFLLSCFGRDLATGGPHVQGEFPNAYEQDSETRRAGKLSAAFG